VTRPLDIDAAGEHFDWWFGNRQWGQEDIWIATTAIGQGNKVRVMRPDDRDGFLASIEDLNRHYPKHDLYFTLCPFAPFPPPGERGKQPDVVALPGLWLDVDIAGGAHAATKLPHPNAEQGAELTNGLLSAYGLSDAATIIRTGGGLHVWIRFAEPVPFDVEDKTLLDRWKAVAVGHFAAAGVHLDRGILSSAATVLRPAGTYSPKYDPPRGVEVLSWGSGHADAATLLARLPGPEPRGTRRVAPPRAARRTGRVAAAKPDAGDDDRPGTRFARLVPPSVILEALDCEHVSGDPDDGDWHWPGSSARANVHVYPPDDDTEDAHPTVTIFSATGQDELGLEGPEHALSSWDLLGIALCDDDWHLAARVARACATVETAEQVFAEHSTPEALAAAFPAPKPRRRRLPPPPPGAIPVEELYHPRSSTDEDDGRSWLPAWLRDAPAPVDDPDDRSWLPAWLRDPKPSAAEGDWDWDPPVDDDFPALDDEWLADHPPAGPPDDIWDEDGEDEDDDEIAVPAHYLGETDPADIPGGVVHIMRLLRHWPGAAIARSVVEHPAVLAVAWSGATVDVVAVIPPSDLMFQEAEISIAAARVQDVTSASAGAVEPMVDPAQWQTCLPGAVEMARSALVACQCPPERPEEDCRCFGPVDPPVPAFRFADGSAHSLHQEGCVVSPLGERVLRQAERA